MVGHRADDRGVSPTVGIALMVAIAVVLAAIIATMALGFQGKLQDPSPQGGFTTQINHDGDDNGGKPYFELTYETGPVTDPSRIIIKDGSGNSVTWEDVWTTSGDVRAGEYIHIDGAGSDGALNHVCDEGQTFYIIHQNDAGETIDTMEYEVPVEPDASNRPSGWC
jgi:flagellin-like protein